MTGLAVVALALAALIGLAWRGFSLLWLAPLLALAAVAASGGGPVLASYTQVFMPAAGGFMIQYFPLFLLGAIFGKLIEATGAARVLADGIVGALGPGRALLAVILSCAALTYGGVSLFVVAFAVWPVAAALFRRAELPKVLIPATIALGAFTFTMTALPGTPAIQNAIPMPFFGTTPYAAPGLGLLTGAVMFGLGWAWLEWRARRLGPGYGAEPDDTQAFAPVAAPVAAVTAPPSLALAALPLVLVLGLNLAFTFAVIPWMDTGYLAEPMYGATDVASVRGLWSVIAALALTSAVVVALNRGRLAGRMGATLDGGARDSLLPIFNTASLVGFGAVIAALPAFAVVRDWAVTAGGDNPLISVAVGTGLLAGITGSASGGMSIALGALGEGYLQAAQVAGMAPDLLHRVTTVATGGLDALPHNGAVITLLTICGLSHRQAYGDIFAVAVLAPLAGLAVLITLGTVFGSF